jgi:zinc transport system substrate-binding protein
MRSLLLGLACVLAVGLGCKPRVVDPPVAAGSDGPVNVAVSFPALYCFVANVVGDTGTVKTIKTAQGAHGSEVTAADRELANSVDMLFVNGLGLDDSFAAKLTKGSNNTTVMVVDLGGKLPHTVLLESDGCECCKKEGDKDAKHDHDEHDHDPHVWMSPDIAKKMVDIVRKELAAKYPAKADKFDANAKAYIAKLDALKEEGKTLLAPTRKADRKLVTAHGSMNYFAASFDLTISGVVQMIPGQEPGATELKALINLCTKENVRVFAAEPQFGTHGGVKAVTEALTNKGITKPVVIELDPLETATREELTLDWYEKKMRANLTTLAKAFAP